MPEQSTMASEAPTVVRQRSCGRETCFPRARISCRRQRPANSRRHPAAARPRPTVTPLASDRYLLRVTLSASAHAKLRRAQDLLRHRLPNGDPAAILEQALTLLVDRLEKDKACEDVQASQDFDDAREALRPFPPHSGLGEARRVGPRRRSMRIRRTARPVHGNRASRISPCDPVRARRVDGRLEHRAALSRAQRV